MTGEKITYTEEDFDGMITEITANMCLVPVSEADRAHNAAMRQAIHFIRLYKEGKGLFQISDSNRHPEQDFGPPVGKEAW